MSETKLKTEKELFFDVQLNWLSGTRGILTADDVKDTMYVATPQVFGGEGQEWSPKHLFLSSVSSCFMSTYLVFARKLGFSISHFECKTVGQVELVNGSYAVTNIRVYPVIYLTDLAQEEKAVKALQLTERHCLISNSINAKIFYHGEIKLETRRSMK